MFKEIVSQISFSPAMIERLSTYAHVLKRRQCISGWSLIIVTSLFIAQTAIALFPVPTITSHSPIDQSSDDFVSAFYDETPASPSSFLSWFDELAEELPSFDAPVIISFYGVCLLVNLFTYFSLRLRAKEIRIIRTQLNTGGL
ncbi:MAG TPA: hypothetical protein PKD28_03010 [Candidatus Saccharibacteria bacterium]|nr:hypothetical protein [Candidatus Saccharibacteria bacterium]